eukprot:TRINITY_DN7008_c0_g2_i11.p1 TRINITY_DN7008_c0_g2~~TRINITY_DN7008_c0_g2_i11.p1  ORF type:complete len:407 (-),score=116.07 TRINITY_DN7008_c0_g2_i11:140-1360(-)
MLRTALLARNILKAQSLHPVFFRSLASTLVVSVATIQIPSLAESITEGTVKSLRSTCALSVDVGDYVKVDEAIASIETGKAAVDIKSPVDGKIVKFFADVDATVLVGNDFAVIDETASPPAETKPKPEEKPKSAEPKAEEAKPKGTKSEVPKAPQAPKPKAEPKPVYEPPAAGARNTRRVPMGKLREAAASRMKESQNTYAMLTTFNECDMSAISTLRKDLGADFSKKYGVELTFMSAFIKAATMSLLKYPAINGVIDGKHAVYHDYVDMSVEVATPKGIIVPVLRNCEFMSFGEIEKSVADMGSRAQTGALALEEMVGGTFSISNCGAYGALLSTPLINVPQSAVMAIHSVKSRAVMANERVEARPMMYLSLSYDHRLVDGREAVFFLKNVKELIEDPRKMLIDI